jgi:hypothetical protein
MYLDVISRKNRQIHSHITHPNMKKTTISALIAAISAILSLASPATAGILTLDDGSPTYTPPGNFSNNTIMVDTIVVGGLIHLGGGVSVTPADNNVATVAVSGTYSAEMGEKFSVAYKFAADLNTETPVTYTLTATVSGVPIPAIDGTIEPGLHLYEGTAEMPFPFPAPVEGDFSGTLTLDFGASGNQLLAAEPGSLDLSVQQIDFQLDTLPVSVQPPAQPQNISTRANVGIGDNALIGGFIITGTDPIQVVLRAIGPSLSVSGVAGVLADPTLELHDSTGAVIASNDNWMENSAEDQMVLTDNNLAPTEDLESAIVRTLDPGAYTVIVRGLADTTGVGLVEAYDVESGATDSKLDNISTRGFVETGENVMIGGFILGGGGGGLSEVIVRGIGPSLADFGVASPLADPSLELHNSDGDVIDSNDNWMDNPNMQTISDKGLAPTDPNEAALYEILPAGLYTAILSGVGDTTGIGLVETYDVDPPVAGSTK